MTQADAAGLVTFFKDVTVQGAGDTANTFNANVVLDGLTFTSDQDTTFGNAGTDTLTINTAPTLVTTAAANRNVIINSATTLNDDLTVSTGNGNVTTNGTIDGNNDLTFNSAGTTRINGRVGGTTPLANLTTDAPGTTELNNSIDVQTGAMTFNDPVSLISSLILTGITGATATFNDTVDGANDLTMAISGATNFNGDVGSTTPIGDGTGAAITVNSTGTTNFNEEVTTASGMTQADAAGLVTFFKDVTVQGAGDTANTFNANVVLDGLTFTSDQDTTFGNAGTDTLTINTAPTLVTTAAANRNVIINSATTLNDDLTVSTGNGNVTTNGTIDGNNDLTFNSAGTTRINGRVGGTTPLANLTTDAPGTTELNNSIDVQTGAMTFNDPVNLISSLTLTGLTGASITFNQTVNGANDLTLAATGPTTFVGVVGNNVPVGDGTGAAITVNSTGATEFQSAVSTNSGMTQADGAGQVTFRDHVTLGAGDTATTFNANVVLDGLMMSAERSVTFGNTGADQVTLSGDDVTVYTLANNGDLTFNAQVDGGQNLILETHGTGDITTNAAVGGTTPLTSVRINKADDVNFNSTVTTTGDLLQSTGTGTTTFAGLATIGGNADIVNGSIAFAGPTGSLNAGAGAGSVVLQALTGTITSGAAASDVIAGTLVATAPAGIATAVNPLRTTVNNVEFSGGAGGAYLFDTAGGLTIGGIGALTNGGFVSGGDIVVQAASPLTVDKAVVNNGGGNTTLEAWGAADGDDVTLNANVSNNGGNGNIEINAGDDVAISAGVSVNAAGTGTITIRAGQDATDGAADAPDGNANGNITMANASILQTDAGDITLDATGGTITHRVNADIDNDNVRGDVSITARTAGIQDTGANALITADEVTLTSFADIGASANPLNLTANALTATITGAGNMFFAAFGDILINLLAANGDINFSTDGNITVGLASAVLGRVFLNAGGSILAPVPSGTTMRIIALGLIRLVATGGTIGTPADPLRYTINSKTPIELRAGGANDGLSVHLLGNLPRSSAISLIDGVPPPGHILHLFRAAGGVHGGQSFTNLVQSGSGLYVPPLPLTNPAYAQLDGQFRDFPGVFNQVPFATPVVVEMDTTGLAVPPALEVPPVPVVPVPPVAPPIPVPPPAPPVPPVIVEEVVPVPPVTPTPAPAPVAPPVVAPEVVPAPPTVPAPTPEIIPVPPVPAGVAVPEITVPEIAPVLPAGSFPGGFMLPPTAGEEGQVLPPTMGEEDLTE